MVSVQIQVLTARLTVSAVAADSPDGTTGWRVQFQKNGVNLGTADASSPYGPKSVNVPPGTYLLTALWTKTGQTPVTQTIGTAVVDEAGCVYTPYAAPPPVPVDAVVSDWAFASATVWSTCVNSSQTRDETWTRTVITPASNGGTTPPLSEIRIATQACVVEPPPPTVKPPLALTDFTYLGFYDVQLGDAGWGMSFTHRYVNGQLRFLTYVPLQGWTQVQEFTLDGLSYGQKQSTVLNRWDFTNTNWGWFGIWWDSAHNRLWTTSAEDYTATANPTQIYTRQLSANTGNNGTQTPITGTMSLVGLNAKRVFGGALAFPQWFQDAAGCGPYGVGFGGYTSLVAQGGGASIGPTLYAVQEPITGETSNYKTLLDFATSRGVRKTIPINYFDGGDPRMNPQTPPTVPPLATAGWLSPNAEGLGWMVWGDTYWNTGMWVETPTKAAFVSIASLGTGKCWYGDSTTHYDGRTYELHVFNPADLIAVAHGTKAPTAVRPAMSELTIPHWIETPPWGGGQPIGNIAGATYDATTGKMYLYGPGLGADHFTNRVWVFQVNQQ